MNLCDEKVFGSLLKMAATVIIKCPKCAGLMLVSTTQKTKLCPYCGTKVIVQKAQKIAAADSSAQAQAILQKLKNPYGFGKKSSDLL